MKVLTLIGILFLTANASAVEVSCEYKNAKGEVMAITKVEAENKAAGTIFAASRDLVVLDDQLYLREGFELALALSGQIQAVKDIDCQILKD